MAVPRLTQKMKQVLEHLYDTNGQADFVNMSTADALASRGLVSMSPNHSKTSGGQFPRYMVTLNTNGRKWCEKYFANHRRGKEN